MLIVVNARSHGGLGKERFLKMQSSLPARVALAEVVYPASVEESDVCVCEAIAAGQRTILAAGGDGTVNSVLNALMRHTGKPELSALALGAIGLGSSNDFHKPMVPEQMADGVPVRVGEPHALVDVGKAAFTDEDGIEHVRYFILNASIGIVAEGNAFFNDGDGLVRRLKQFHTELAIVYSALVNIVQFQPIEISMQIDDAEQTTEWVTNASILKSPHFAGGMRYDTPVGKDDGMFDINTWLGMGKLRRVATVANLYQGKFSGKPATRCQRGSRVCIESAQPMHLEMDGEIVTTRNVELTVVPHAIMVCA